jgi:hypothetical protein
VSLFTPTSDLQTLTLFFTLHFYFIYFLYSFDLNMVLGLHEPAKITTININYLNSIMGVANTFRPLVTFICTGNFNFKDVSLADFLFYFIAEAQKADKHYSHKLVF